MACGRESIVPVMEAKLAHTNSGVKQLSTFPSRSTAGVAYNSSWRVVMPAAAKPPAACVSDRQSSSADHSVFSFTVQHSRQNLPKEDIMQRSTIIRPLRILSLPIALAIAVWLLAGAGLHSHLVMAQQDADPVARAAPNQAGLGAADVVVEVSGMTLSPTSPLRKLPSSAATL
jgi:hypothetical protein